MNYNTIFFDVGNTLFFFNYEFLRDLLVQRYHIPITTAELESSHLATKRSLIDDKLMNMPHSALWVELYKRWLLRIGVEEDMIKPISDAIRTHPFRHLFWTRMEEGTSEMLDWFRERGFKLGIISNAEGQIKRLIEHVNMDNKFDCIIDSGVVGYDKPDERIFKHALSKLNANPLNTVHVGDIFDIDVIGAKKAGITPVLVDRNESNVNADCLKIRRAVDLPTLKIFRDDD